MEDGKKVSGKKKRRPDKERPLPDRINTYVSGEGSINVRSILAVTEALTFHFLSSGSAERAQLYCRIPGHAQTCLPKGH